MQLRDYVKFDNLRRPPRWTQRERSASYSSRTMPPPASRGPQICYPTVPDANNGIIVMLHPRRVYQEDLSVPQPDPDLGCEIDTRSRASHRDKYGTIVTVTEKVRVDRDLLGIQRRVADLITETIRVHYDTTITGRTIDRNAGALGSVKAGNELSDLRPTRPLGDLVDSGLQVGVVWGFPMWRFWKGL
ncbi:hypothetical protein BD311DRAFT_472776 [Dichomitus squalens]|uniref:Uncharacterized protein n=1 Tax=Dichomitus squalens TaxID=114155 RepID=A0A4Q9MZL8_9APHY|nr:hypothetical protein BD311DRAFT_472776 [Dichomitus squalens]